MDKIEFDITLPNQSHDFAHKTVNVPEPLLAAEYACYVAECDYDGEHAMSYNAWLNSEFGSESATHLYMKEMEA